MGWTPGEATCKNIQYATAPVETSGTTNGMGRSKKHREKFLADNPLCCFCGGKTPTAEPDHVPSRTLFDGREWPEGFEFPACRNCNQATRYDEQIVSMLSRIHSDGITERGVAEVQESIRAVAANRPAVLREMNVSKEREQEALAKYPLEHRRMPDGRLPILSARGPLVNGAIASFTRKLYCALWYKHASRILPSTGGIRFRWYTNLQIEADEIPRDLAPLIKGYPVLRRQHTNLDDQFFYRWGITEEKSMGVFLALFRKSFGILGFVSDDVERLRIKEEEELADKEKEGKPFGIVRPYDYSTHSFRSR